MNSNQKTGGTLCDCCAKIMSGLANKPENYEQLKYSYICDECGFRVDYKEIKVKENGEENGKTGT